MLVAERIKGLRESYSMTQSELAKRLGITRSGENAWEMGISIPSTQYIVELALLFGVSSDYLLGISRTAAISVEGLSDKEVTAVLGVVECFRSVNNS